MNKTIKRWLVYCIGILVLAFGLILNTKCGLGTSAIIAIASVGSNITGLTIGDVTLIEYIVFIIIELIVDTLNKKDKKALVMDVLQFPFSIVFSRFMNLFANMIPSFAGYNLIIRIITLIIAIAATALGAVFMLSMKLVLNPGDGITLSLSDATKKEIGFVKNCIDFACFFIVIAICLLTNNSIQGIGIGTILCMIGIGRFISLFNYLLKEKLVRFAEMD